MASVSFNARERRLVLEGLCWPTDARGVARAIEGYAEPSHVLVLDLTRLASVPAEVADAIATACAEVEQRHCPVRVWTLPGTPGTQRISSRHDRSPRSPATV
jgi:hypothetical protein